MVEGAESSELMERPEHPYTQLLLAAVPDPEAGLFTQQVQARGEIPSLIDPPPCCPFLPRYPHAMEICHTEIANPRMIAPNHWVRCHLYEPGGTQPVIPLERTANEPPTTSGQA